MNTFFQEKKRLPGSTMKLENLEDSPLVNYRPYSRSLNEGKYYIWFKGDGKIAIVNTDTFKFKELSLVKSGSFPIGVTTNSDLTKIVILSVKNVEGVTTFFINFW